MVHELFRPTVPASITTPSKANMITKWLDLPQFAKTHAEINADTVNPVALNSNDLRVVPILE